MNIILFTDRQPRPREGLPLIKVVPPEIDRGGILSEDFLGSRTGLTKHFSGLPCSLSPLDNQQVAADSSVLPVMGAGWLSAPSQSHHSRNQKQRTVPAPPGWNIYCQNEEARQKVLFLMRVPPELMSPQMPHSHVVPFNVQLCSLLQHTGWAGSLCIPELGQTRREYFWSQAQWSVSPSPESSENPTPPPAQYRMGG